MIHPRRRTPRTRAASPVLAGLAVIVLCASACGAAGAADEPVVRDSAGITIVENAPGAAEAVPHWVVGPEPTLRIGVVDGDPAYMFHRLWAGTGLPDGRIAVIDVGSRQVRVFGRDGRIVALQGREGEGPGEYAQPQWIWRLPGDSIAVFDPRLSRVTILRLAGDSLGLARVVQVKHGLMNPDFAGTLDGGRIVITDREYDISGPIGPQYADVWTAALDDDAPADSVFRYVHGHHGALPGGAELGRRVGSPIFGAHGMVAARGDRIVYGPGDDHALRVHDPDGRLRRIVRWHGPARTPDPAQVAAWKDTVVATTPEQYRPDTRRWLDLLPVSERTPAHHRFLFDDAGRLWVSRWSPWDRQLGTDWWVFDPDGRMIATAEMPEGMVVLWIGEGEVIGRVEDEVGVEYLVGVGVQVVQKVADMLSEGRSLSARG